MFKKILFVFIILSAAQIVNAFTPPKNIIEAKKLQDASENLLTTQPDSFKTIYKYLEQDTALFSLLINGKTYNGLARYYLQGRNSDSAEYYVKKAIQAFNDFPLYLASAKTSYGIILKQKGLFNDGLVQLKEALKIYTDSNKTFKALTCKSTIATIYSKLGLTELSSSLLIETLDTLNNYPDTLQSERTRIKQLLAVNYQESQQWKFAEKIYLEIIPEFKANNQMYYYYITLLNLSEVLLYLNQLDEALSVVNESINGLIELKNNKLIPLAKVSRAKINLKLNNKQQIFKDLPELLSQTDRLDFYQLRAVNIYLELAIETERYDIAEKLVDRLYIEDFEKYLQLSDLLTSYELISEYAAATNKPELEISSLRNVITLSDSVELNENRIASMALQEQYMNQLLLQENELNTLRSQSLSSKLKIARIVNLGIVILLVTLLVVLVLAIRSYKLKTTLNQKKLESREAYNELLVQNQNILEQKNEAQKQLLESQKRELLANTLKVNSLNERINELIANTTDEKHKKVLQSILNKEDYYDSFIQKFKSINPTFMSNLNEKFPELTSGELEFCALLKLNLSLKEIANILQITHESAITKKYRITKKLNHYPNFDLNEAIQETE